MSKNGNLGNRLIHVARARAETRDLQREKDALHERLEKMEREALQMQVALMALVLDAPDGELRIEAAKIEKVNDIGGKLAKIVKGDAVILKIALPEEPEEQPERVQ